VAKDKNKDEVATVEVEPHVEDDESTEDENENAPTRIDSIVPKPTASAPRRIPTTKEWVKFSGDYAHMQVQIWVDAPAKTMEGLSPKAVGETDDDVRARVLETLGKIVLSHQFDDGTPWEDDEGILPQPQDPVFWDRTPQPIVNALIAYIRARISDHPTLRRLGTMRRR